MNGAQTEKRLTILYSTAAILSTVSMICIVTAWQYWAWTLNVCIDINCGCIFYSINTLTTFMGGNVKLCHFATYGLLPVIFYGICLGIYHGYRICISPQLGEPKIATTSATYCNRNNIDGDVVIVIPKGRAPCKQWLPPTFIAALICCLSLAHAILVTDGYYKTCEQYKKHLIRILGSRGREAKAIYDRLGCGAIFDFMDYVQPDTNNYRRGDEINTGLSLQLAIVTTWFNIFVWIIIVGINFNMVKRKHRNRNETVCCCCC
ncbi:hypothetical protein PV326_003767 [Microctonus aethiopoides]|uniref:Uncharacterized protein n=1 Tax=Microctonus aethiopoides TaxID=144406 RepID=A0AA39F6G2_9HYME|nr:hypothetical protein PV326_003767 [Microctonus aethiopoides]KAK0163829.1 hypothetical protein PV328_002519 [Microctonus aethiopoides]